MNTHNTDVSSSDQGAHPWTCLALGQAALHQALVTPLGLDIKADGEWTMFQYISLPGHPHPGNAKRGFSHPVELKAWQLSCGRVGRLPGPLERLPRTQSDVVSYACALCAWLWPGDAVKIEIARFVGPGVVGVSTYDESGGLVRYGDADADAYDLMGLTLLRRLNRVQLATLATSGDVQGLQRAHAGGSCWEDYPGLPGEGNGLLGGRCRGLLESGRGAG